MEASSLKPFIISLCKETLLKYEQKCNKSSPLQSLIKYHSSAAGSLFQFKLLGQSNPLVFGKIWPPSVIGCHCIQ